MRKRGNIYCVNSVNTANNVNSNGSFISGGMHTTIGFEITRMKVQTKYQGSVM